ncbi:MAG: hypothetical protein VCC99_08330, partial [Alphaproteobacteria bacterium]
MVLKSLLSPVFIAPATMAALPAVNILLRIGYPIASASAAIFIAIQVALGIGLGLLCHRLPHTQRAILTGLMAWLIWQGEWEGIRTWCAASSAEYSVDVRLVFSVAMIGGILVVYGIVSALKQNAALVAAAFAGVSLIGTLAFVGFDQGEIATRPDIESQLDSSLAPFVFIVLDEHAGIGGLPPDHPDTPQVAARLRETYRDFANHEKAYSRYTDTRISVPAMMNGHTGDDHPVTTPSSTGWPIGDTLLYRQLRERGYQIRTYSSGYPDLCEPKVTACHRVSNWHMSLLERSEVSLLAKIE